MDRDALLVLLLVGVLLNTGLLLLVALLRAAPWRGTEEGQDAVSPPSPRATAPDSGARRPEPAWRSGWPAAAPTPRPIIAMPLPLASTAPQVKVAPTAAPVVAARIPPADGAGTPESVGAARSAHDAVRESTGRPARRVPERTESPRRPRRFTLPDLEEDHDRAARSIAAFLGEPVAPSAGARPHRRRHRARRPAGASARTAVVLVLAGETPSPKVGHAIAAALRDVVRESDEVVELPGGRLRISLDADATGSDVFADRAQSVVRPWLELVRPKVELRVERPGRDSHEESAAS